MPRDDGCTRKRIVSLKLHLTPDKSTRALTSLLTTFLLLQTYQNIPLLILALKLVVRYPQDEANASVSYLFRNPRDSSSVGFRSSSKLSFDDVEDRTRVRTVVTGKEIGDVDMKRRFKEAVMKISSFMDAHKCPELAKRYSDKVAKTMDEMMTRLDKFVKSKEAFTSTELPNGEALEVKNKREKDKIRTKPDKNGKRGESGKSQEQSQSIKEEKLNKM
uniref:Reverse transcriptase domain-containing protein n=1 Tax=Tanacetum cinerariifolium TaxID=118510 RepID=A0A699HY49_TANCI|nr:reverse transcriptase domain-containing protein [Tanacetum cinerariifolium]